MHTALEEIDSQASTVPDLAQLPPPQNEQEQTKKEHEPAVASARGSATTVQQKKSKRAPTGELGRGAVYDRSRFDSLVPKALELVDIDVTNRCFFFPPPVTGVIDCRFVGKTDDPDGQIKAHDSVCFEWSYSNKIGDIVVSGKALAHHRAKELLYGQIPYPCVRRRVSTT